MRIKISSLLLINLLFIGSSAYAFQVTSTKTAKHDTTTTDKKLAAMNNVFVPAFTDTSSTRKGKPFKVLVIGNSLTQHGIAEKIGWNHLSGMAATSQQTDFVHLLFDRMETRLPNHKIHLRISNFADFERELPALEKSRLKPFLEFNPDLVIFQLGENVKVKNGVVPPLFQERYTELIQQFKRRNKKILTICTTPFFPSMLKNEVVQAVALNTGSYLVDLSHLTLLEPQNRAKDEIGYNGDRSVWLVDGIGAHPGDVGMRNIADQIFVTISAILIYKRD